MAKIRGGMEFTQGALARLPPPPETLPARPLRFITPGRPDVEVGQVIESGAILFDSGMPSESCVISPVAGRISHLRKWHGDVGLRTPRYDIEIAPTGDVMPTAMTVESPADRTPEQWLSTLRRLGPWTRAEPCLNLIEQLAAACDAGPDGKPDTLICVGLDSFPPYPVRSSLLDCFSDDAVVGTRMLADVFDVKHVIMLVPARTPVPGRVRQSCRNFKVALRAAANVYPSANPTLVAAAHAPGRRKLAPGQCPIEQRLVLIEPWTAIRTARWITLGKLDVIRPMMIGWPSKGEAMTATYAMPGQTLDTLHRALSGNSDNMLGRVVRGNPMTGSPFTTAAPDDRQVNPILPEAELLISVLPRRHAAAREACISCGWCSQICPTGLRPVHLAERIEHDRITRRVQRHIDVCIDCGLCTHCCPSSIPLAETISEKTTPTISSRRAS